MCTRSLNVHALPSTVTKRTVSPEQLAHLDEYTVLEHNGTAALHYRNPKP
jgi:hypothetical protein